MKFYFFCGDFEFTWFEAQLNHASQTEPPCQRKLLMLNMEWSCCCNSFSSSLIPTSLSVSLRLVVTIASSAWFGGNIVSIFFFNFLRKKMDLRHIKKVHLMRQKKKERDQTLPQKTKAKKKKHTHHTTPDPDHWKFLCSLFHKKKQQIPPHKKRLGKLQRKSGQTIQKKLENPMQISIYHTFH